jgi:hypothetical protein
MAVHALVDQTESAAGLWTRLTFNRVGWLALKQQFFQVWLLGVSSLGLALLVLVAVVIGGLTSGTALSKLTRDMATVAGVKFYIGLLSNLGLMLWAATATICWFGELVLHRTRPVSSSAASELVKVNLGVLNDSPAMGAFLRASGLVSFVLLFDDTFLLHEVFFPKYLHIPELVVFAGYLLLFGAYLLNFRRTILGSNYLLLLVAVGCLGFSMVIDEVLPLNNFITFIEDSLKFVGIVFWLVYFAETTLGYIKLRNEN